MSGKPEKYQAVEFDVPKVDADGNPISKSEQKRMIKGTYSTFIPLMIPGSNLTKWQTFFVNFIEYLKELKKKKEAEEKAKKVNLIF